MRLENDRVLLELDDASGGVISLKDKLPGREYVAKAQAAAPFGVVLDGGAQPLPFDFSAHASEGLLSLCWTMAGAKLTASVSLLPDGVSFRAALQPDASACVKVFEYPLLALANLGTESYLAHAYATGVLLRDPLAYLPEEGALRYTPYPEAFSGASMQFFTYYEQNKGGLYFAALDGEGHQKWLNTYRAGQTMIASHMAGFENVTPGSAIEMTYDFVVRFTGGAGWQEAAALYKPWAWQQRWCRRPKARDRAEKADWLLEKVGLCTFGVNAGHDRTRWMRRYRQDAGTPVFHVLGPDWTNVPQTFYCGVPGDMCDWVPTRFNQENLRDIREQGDYFAPFEFDYLVSMTRSNPETLRPHLQHFPRPTLSHDAYDFTMLCPCEPFTKDFHRERDLTVLREAGVDAMYYDISCNNLIKVCMADHHAHRPGGGKEITDAYLDVYDDTQAALSREAGKYIPLGTEMMNETCLSSMDFYQARAWGQPSSALETYPFREQMRSGLAQMIPLFDYVYHEMGVVRMDGWGKLVRETGDFFHHVVARVYLWGGLYEINHEYSPMEELDGVENPPQEHYFPFDPQHNAYAPDRAAYLRQFAQARIGLANPYWAYGAMTVTPPIDIPRAEAQWYHYNLGQTDTSYKAGGTLSVPAVTVSAFEDGNGGYALFLANGDGQEHVLTIPLSHAALHLTGGDRRLRLVTHFEQPDALQIMDFGMLQAAEERTISVALAPRTLYMLEIK